MGDAPALLTFTGPFRARTRKALGFTASKKVYPEALCGIFASEILEELHLSFDAESAMDDFSIERFLGLLDCFQSWDRYMYSDFFVTADFRDKGVS